LGPHPYSGEVTQHINLHYQARLHRGNRAEGRGYIGVVAMSDAPKGRLLYPTVYVAREGMIQEARSQLAEIVDRIGPAEERCCRYDPEPKMPRKAYEPKSIHTPVRRTSAYKRPSSRCVFDTAMKK